MIPLLNAIYSRFTGSSALGAAFPGGMFRDRAVEGAAMAYLVTHVVSSKAELAYGGIYRVETQVKFAGYGVGHDATGAAMGVLTGAFDDQPVTLSVGVNDVIARLGEPTPVLHRHDASGNDVWEWSVVYLFGVVGG